ncbi:unnamed protein product, partial [Ectocarpus sp. 13 AM-2016]
PEQGLRQISNASKQELIDALTGRMNGKASAAALRRRRSSCGVVDKLVSRH